MDTRGIFEMIVVFTIMIGCGTAALDRNQPETTRSQAIAIIAGLVGVMCPSPVTNAIKRKNENQDPDPE